MGALRQSPGSQASNPPLFMGDERYLFGSPGCESSGFIRGTRPVPVQKSFLRATTIVVCAAAPLSSGICKRPGGWALMQKERTAHMPARPDWANSRSLENPTGMGLRVAALALKRAEFCYEPPPAPSNYFCPLLPTWLLTLPVYRCGSQFRLRVPYRRHSQLWRAESRDFSCRLGLDSTYHNAYSQGGKFQ